MPAPQHGFSFDDLYSDLMLTQGALMYYTFNNPNKLGTWGYVYDENDPSPSSASARSIYSMENAPINRNYPSILKEASRFSPTDAVKRCWAFPVSGGYSGYLAAPTAWANLLGGATAISVCGWFRPGQNEVSDGEKLFSLSGTDVWPPRTLTIFFRPSRRLQIYIAAAVYPYKTASIYTANNAYRANMWHHYAGIFDYDNKILKLYVNSRNVAQVAFPADFPETAFTLGGNPKTHNPIAAGQDGACDGLALFNRVLTDQEILDQYLLGAGTINQSHNYQHIRRPRVGQYSVRHMRL
jgi:hypothetical protein